MKILTVDKDVVKLSKEQGEKLFGEYPIFNDCEHTVVDLSHLRVDEEWMHTLSVKLPNDRYVTLCVMQASDTMTCVDVQYTRDEEKDRTWAVGFKDGQSESMGDNNLFTVVCDVKKESNR